MNRRAFLMTSASSIVLAQASAEEPRNSWYLLRYYFMRSGSQVTRTTQYLSGVQLPAARRLGLGPFGYFNAVVADRSPFILAMMSYPSLAAMEKAESALAEDKDFQKGFDEFNSGEPPYIRIESSLLRSFDAFPAITLPPAGGEHAARIFELRTYESPNQKAGRRKIRMFEEGEAAIFRRLGMLPVMFGETIVGPNMPSLTYMLAFDNLASRERMWQAFGADPEWQKLRAQPGLSDAEIVSNISNAIVRPLPFSMIR